jgi:uncharacterized protein RhaS with RHS repeats
MSGGFGLAGLRREGGMIDPDTHGTVETEERRQELIQRYAAAQAKRLAYERSPAGRLEALLAPFKRAWTAFRNTDTGY